MLEHRWGRRIATNFKVMLKAGRRGHIPAIIRNISLYGLFVETRARLDPGNAVTLSFRDPDGEQTEQKELSALVIHHTEHGMGLMVDIKAPAARQLLQSLTTQSWTPNTAGLFAHPEPRMNRHNT